MNVTVIKIGGALIQQPDKTVTAVRELNSGPTILVHGGGIQITRLLERFGVASQFVDGLRVTDATTLQIAAMALIGDVHTHLIQAFRDAKVPAIGVFGAVRATQKSGPLGFVGSALKVERDTIDVLLEAGKIPVIPTFAIGDGNLLNVNGDETAAAVAIAVQAKQLIFMTDVPGVKDANGAVISTVPNPKELLSADFISGGMIPKLKSVAAALDGGVESVRVGQTRFGTTL